MAWVKTIDSKKKLMMFQDAKIFGFYFSELILACACGN